MPVRRLVVALALAMLAVMPGQALGASSAVGVHRIAIDSGTTFPDPVQTAQRHSYVVLHAWQASTMRRLKAANPNLKVLVYKNLSTTVSYHSSDPFQPTGVRYDDANANHPEWYLNDTSGQRIQFRSYPGLWQMDIGNPEYQRAWADQVIAEVQREGWDGVELDDVNPTIKYHFDPSRVAKYPNDAAFGAATRSMLAHVGPRIQAAGKLAIPNICCTTELGVGIWKDWLQFVSGAYEESYTKWDARVGEGYRWDWGTSGWAAHLEQGLEAARQGKILMAHAWSQPDDAAAMRFGLATLMLSAEGRSSFGFGASYSTEPWFPEYDLDIGAPAEAYRRSEAVYSRKYADGLVLVNPSRSPQQVALGGTYSGSGLERVSSVTMGPTTGLILKRSDAATAPTTSTPPGASEPSDGSGGPVTTPPSDAPAPTSDVPSPPPVQPDRSYGNSSSGASDRAPADDAVADPALPVTSAVPVAAPRSPVRCPKAARRARTARRACVRAVRRARAQAQARARVARELRATQAAASEARVR